jgi:4-hydroxy-4-methyl-2-oxoglutarate aldolase
MDIGIQALKRGWKVVGPAVTVHLDEPSTLIPQLAIDLAEPGDVIVVAAHGRTEIPSWGGGMAVWAARRGLAGAVIDGSVGGADPLLNHDWPVFCRATTPRFDLPHHPGSINVPVVCGGVAVSPGDVIIGNADGVVVVPQYRIESVTDQLAALDRDLDRWGVREGASLIERSGLRQVIDAMPIEWVD